MLDSAVIAQTLRGAWDVAKGKGVRGPAGGSPLSSYVCAWIGAMLGYVRQVLFKCGKAASDTTCAAGPSRLRTSANMPTFTLAFLVENARDLEPPVEFAGARLPPLHVQSADAQDTLMQELC